MRDYVEQVRHKSAFCNLRFSEKDNTITVTCVTAGRRRLGHGTGLMKIVCQTADYRKVRLVLKLRRFHEDRFDEDGLNTEQLVRFYEKFGFVMRERGFMVRDYREETI